MNGEDRVPESEQRLTNRGQREQLYTGEGYEHDARLQRRRIGSLVQSEEMGSDERSVRRRTSAVSDGAVRHRTFGESETAGRRRTSEGTGSTSRRVALSESENTGARRVSEETRSASRRVTLSESENRVGRRVSEETGSTSRHRTLSESEAASGSRRKSEAKEEGGSKRKTAAEQESSGRKKATAASEGAKSSTGWKERMQERKRKRLRRIFIGLGSVIGVIYVAVAIYFGFHFYENTIIYGVDCSQKTVDLVKEEVADRLDEYVLTLECREGKTETISAEQIDLEFVDNSSIDQILKAQHSYIWPIMMLLDHTPEVSVAFSYDKTKAEQVLDSMTCMDAVLSVAPRDAYIGTTDTGFEVVPEIMGTTLDRSRTLEVLISALDGGATAVSLEKEGCYVDPQVYSDDKELNADAEAMSELARAYITYDFGDQKEVVNAPVIRDWIVELSDGTFVIDDMCVTEYVENLAAKYDTFGLPVTFYTSIGTVESLSGGDYGWCIDQDETIVALLNALAEGYQGTMEPVYLFSAMSHENNGIGYTYVEICISQQRMWCYQEGNLVVDTPVVTGNPNKDWGTPSGGVWAIDAKKRDAILEGEGYEEPVDYWMPFNDNIGIHDFQERYHFGGTIYLTNGSHGCVNTPYEAVQTIFDVVSIGTPVIVYE